MKNLTLSTAMIVLFFLCTAESCDSTNKNKTAMKEQAQTEQNQQGLLSTQPPPRLTWSLERDNLIKRFKLENDRSVMFYMYVFIEGISQPVGYYQVNKVSSVNSQLTNPEQVITNEYTSNGWAVTLPSPSEDGSYGTNGDGIFGFTPEEIYIEHNMKYIVSTVPLTFKTPVNNLAIINIETEKKLKEMMSKINAQ